MEIVKALPSLIENLHIPGMREANLKATVAAWEWNGADNVTFALPDGTTINITASGSR